MNTTNPNYTTKENDMTPEKIKALVENMRALIENYKAQQERTAELFEICLEFLVEDPHRVYYTDADIQREGGVFKAQKASAIRRKERKQQLIAAIKGYITMIKERSNEHTVN